MYKPKFTAEENLHNFGKVLDNLAERLPGTKVIMPSGYEQCSNFMARVVPQLPVTVRIAIETRYQTEVKDQENEGFFTSATESESHEFYRELLTELLEEAQDLARNLPPPPEVQEREFRGPETSAGARARQQREGRQDRERSQPLTKRGRDKSQDRGNGKKQSRTKSTGASGQGFAAFKEHLRENGVNTSHLESDPAKCLYCGSRDHRAYKCTAYIKRAHSDPAKAESCIKARKLAKEFYKK